MIFKGQRLGNKKMFNFANFLKKFLMSWFECGALSYMWLIFVKYCVLKIVPLDKNAVDYPTQSRITFTRAVVFLFYFMIVVLWHLSISVASPRTCLSALSELEFKEHMMRASFHQMNIKQTA